MRFAAFVRAVMIGREGLHRVVLLDLAERAGGGNPVSYISTGNLTVDLDRRDVDRWRAEVEDGIEDVIGRRAEVFVRSIAHLTELAESDPFAASPITDPAERVVSFLSEPLPPDAGPFADAAKGVHVFDVRPTEVFSVNEPVRGRVTGPGGLIEKTLGQRITTRAWGTIDRILRTPTG